MKILVPVKRVIDYNVKVRVKSDQSGVELENVKMAINPFDEIAVEQAIRMVEAGQATEVVVVSIGPKQCQDTLRAALAMGADRGIHIPADQGIEPLAVAKLLKGICEREQPKLVLCGKQAIDDDANQTAQALAGLCNWGQATFVSKIDLQGDMIETTREIDGGLEILKVQLPAIISVDLRLNEPRYASLPNIMKAKKKPIDTIEADDLGVDTSQRLTIIKTFEPTTRKAGEIVDSVATLVDKLRNEAKVI